MTTTYDWSTTRDYIIETTGDTPSNDLEQRIIDVWKQHPAEIQAVAVQICGGYQQGTVRSVWAVLDKRSQEISQRRSYTVTPSPDREKKIGQVAQWMRAAGLHFDRWSEVEDELFGYGGRLQPWADDDELKHEMEMLWVKLRPAGEQVEREAVERAEAWKRAQALRKAEPPRPSSGVSLVELERRMKLPDKE